MFRKVTLDEIPRLIPLCFKSKSLGLVPIILTRKNRNQTLS
jgi:hypothetical protein